MNDHLIALYGYERHGGADAELWNNPKRFSELTTQQGKIPDEDYDNWFRGKRRFTEDELFNKIWLKEGNHGYSFKVKFFPQGGLLESDSQSNWEGKWEIESGLLKITVDVYSLYLLASRDGNHSGVEYVNGNRHAYFTFTELKEYNDPLDIRKYL